MDDANTLGSTTYLFIQFKMDGSFCKNFEEGTKNKRIKKNTMVVSCKIQITVKYIIKKKKQCNQIYIISYDRITSTASVPIALFLFFIIISTSAESALTKY